MLAGGRPEEQARRRALEPAGRQPCPGSGYLGATLVDAHPEEAEPLAVFAAVDREPFDDDGRVLVGDVSLAHEAGENR